MKTHQLLDDPVAWSDLLQTKNESYWISRGRAMCSALYREMKATVPAYKAFLSAKKAKKFTTERDFFSLPICDKESYLRAYPLKQLVAYGQVAQGQWTIAATSGSTGEPFYFPRTELQDKQYAAVAEMYLRMNFQIHKKSTLYIIGWGMGVWIGGVFSYSAVRMVSIRGNYNLSIITPGTNKEEILSAVVRLGKFYDQVIIGGYPPMIKDLIDLGNSKHVNWASYPVKFIFSAEGFSEDFRDYIIAHAGLTNPYTDTLNHYGTVDLGTMAHETPIAILVRRLAREHVRFNESLFGHRHRQPTLGQYIPELFYFEEVNRRVVCTARSGLPLVRYDLFDTGGVLRLSDIYAKATACGIDIAYELQRHGIKSTVWNLPFVYVFERSDFTVKLYGGNIFPQEVRRALESTKLTAYVTGKCTLEIRTDSHMDQYLAIHVECKPGVSSKKSVADIAKQCIISELLAHNSEYSYLHGLIKKRSIEPKIVLHPYQTAPWFAPGGKQRWVRKV